MSMICVENVSFGYDNSFDMVFENLHFQIDTNWKLGFIGRNGRGKTTFLNLLLGKYEYEGHIHSSVNFEYFPYHVEDKNRNTIEILQTICPDSMDWEIICELEQLDVKADVLYRPFCTLSNGEQTKTLLAALFLTANAFLLIDEPTNHLDINARNAVMAYLKRKKGFILVSHDRVLLDECIDHVLSINQTTIDVQKGNFSSWYYNKEKRDYHEKMQNEKLKKEIKRLSTSANRTSEWSDRVEKSKYGTKNAGLKVDKGYIGHKSAKMMKRSKNLESRQQSMIEEKTALMKDIEMSENLIMHPISHFAQKLVFLSNISIFYGENEVFKNFSLDVMQGERIAICGKNGCGKSSLLKLINDKNMQYTGDLLCASNLKISFVSQNTSEMSGTLYTYAQERKIDETLFMTILRKMGFDREQFNKQIQQYSEGQKKKVLLAASLCEQAHLYIWDEPLNYIDVITRIQIEDVLLTYKPTLIFVEHDTAFIEKIATRVIQIT